MIMVIMMMTMMTMTKTISAKKYLNKCHYNNDNHNQDDHNQDYQNKDDKNKDKKKTCNSYLPTYRGWVIYCMWDFLFLNMVLLLYFFVSSDVLSDEGSPFRSSSLQGHSAVDDYKCATGHYDALLSHNKLCIIRVAW